MVDADATLRWGGLGGWGLFTFLELTHMWMLRLG